ncbi:MAG: hypothetical protein H7Y17_07205 [Chlorobia bacterium]|nr:hypothetical protein [Fimbriimonadaceae bacterium]
MRKLSLFALSCLTLGVVGCSGGDEVTETPPAVKANDKNNFDMTIDKGGGVTEDKGPGGKASSPEGTG